MVSMVFLKRFMGKKIPLGSWNSELKMSDCFHLLSLWFRMDNCLFLVVKVNYSSVSLILCSR